VYIVIVVVFCSEVLQSRRRWCNGLELFHGLELCSALEMLLRARCLTELEPELVISALANCPSFAKDGWFSSLNVYFLFVFISHQTAFLFSLCDHLLLFVRKYEPNFTVIVQ